MTQRDLFRPVFGRDSADEVERPARELEGGAGPLFGEVARVPRRGSRPAVVVWVRPEDQAPRCDECGAPDGVELSCFGRVLVTRGADGRARCEGCATEL